MGAPLCAKSDFEKVYEIDTPVGRGRKSVVYKARPMFDLFRHSSIDVALKVLIAGSKNPVHDLLRLKKEAVAMLSCRHRNIVQLYDYIVDSPNAYLAMEFAHHGDLRQLLDARGKPLEVVEALNYMKQVAEGLAAVHRVGIVHRDIKPENLLLTELNIIKIADFGIAFLPTEIVEESEANQGIGTFEYLAPESLEDGISNQATDIYSCAVTLFQLLTGELPFCGSSFTEQIDNKMNGNVSSVSKFGMLDCQNLDRFFEIALSADPKRRYNTAREFYKALSALVKGEWTPEKSNVLVMRPKTVEVVEEDETLSTATRLASMSQE